MQKRKIHSLLAGVTLAAVASSANAGYKMTDEKSGISVNLGGRLQFLTLANDEDLKPTEDTEFSVRRARFRLGIDISPMASMFLQTDLSNSSGTGSGDEARLIDAFITIKPSPWAQLIGGLRMAPVTRQNLTSSGALIAMDRPGISNYNLTWGMKGNTGFQTGTVSGTSSGTFGDNQVRDYGFTLFGSGGLQDNVSLKYYLGISEGSLHSDDSDRFTARAQLNIGDAESGYFGLSNYLGKKDTMAIGIAYDSQDSFARDSVTLQQVDYALLTIDAFMDKPMADGTLTLEAAYIDLDLDDTPNALAGQTSTTVLGGVAKQTQGDGFYIQGGFLIGKKWQPFALYESWSSDGDLDAGSWESYRVGVNYYIKGHNANIKFGVEQTDNDLDSVGDITTVGLGLYINY